MSNERENAQINQLATQVAVIDEKISTINQNLKEQRGDMKAINASIQAFTFVKEVDYNKDLRTTSTAVKHLEARVSMLEENTSVMVKFKNAVGERGTQLLVLIFFALIIFGMYLVLKHSAAVTVLNGSGATKE